MSGGDSDLSPANPASEQCSDLKIIPLSGERVLQAYPLIRDITPHVSLSEWQSYLATFGEPSQTGSVESGAYALIAPSGHVLALWTFRIGLDLEQGRTLIVDHVKAAGMPSQRVLVHAALNAVEELAQRHACTAIHISCPVKLGWLFRLVRHWGYWRCRWRFCKRV